MESTNNAQCKLCKTVIISRSRHDFQRCKCGAISVDGGNDYIKRCGEPENFLEVPDEVS